MRSFAGIYTTEVVTAIIQTLETKQKNISLIYSMVIIEIFK